MKILGISGFPRLQEKKDLSMKEKNEKLLSPKNMRDLPSSNVDVCGWWWVNNKTKKTQLEAILCAVLGRNTGVCAQFHHAEWILHLQYSRDSVPCTCTVLSISRSECSQRWSARACVFCLLASPVDT